MRYINTARLACLVSLVVLFAAHGARADERPADAGVAAYHDGDYKLAADSFKLAIQASPQNSALHHWLGKCYGRMAERGNWFRSMSYAGKTLKQFRKAVELDANNYEALRDLVDYLDTAPGFLGGNKKEAEALGQTLEKLHAARSE